MPRSAAELRIFCGTFLMPPDVLFPNQAPGHWGAKTGERAKYRLVCGTHAKALWGGSPPMDRATLRLQVIFCRQRSRDPDNCLAACKALLDSLVDAGILVTDSRTHLVSITVETTRHAKHKPLDQCHGGLVRVELREVS